MDPTPLLDFPRDVHRRLLVDARQRLQALTDELEIRLEQGDREPWTAQALWQLAHLAGTVRPPGPAQTARNDPP